MPELYVEHYHSGKWWCPHDLTNDEEFLIPFVDAVNRLRNESLTEVEFTVGISLYRVVLR